MKRMFGAGSAFLCLTGALAALTVGAAPDDAYGQGRTPRGSQQRAAKPAAAGALDLVRGAAEAPAAVRAAGVGCTVTAGAYLGASGVQVNGAVVPRNAYEVACREGLGYIVLVPQTAGAAPPMALDCVAAQTTARAEQAAGRTAGLQCRLPANANPALGLQALAREAGATCTVTNARAMGRLTTTNSIRYEIACSEGAGYFLDRPETAGARPVVQTCFRGEATSGGQIRCQFTTKAQSLAALNPVITQSRRQCTVTDARIVGRNPTTQNEVTEIGCQGAPGFFVETAANGGFVQSYDCGRFGNTPCQLTAASAVQERNAADYTRLLRAANFDCAVANFTRMGSEQGTGREIVEVACSNRPDGAFALLAASSGGASEVYDCLMAPKRRQQCRLTQEEALYPKLNAALAGQKARCNVTMTRRMGTTPQGEDWFEFACAEGRNYVVDYRGNGVVRQVLTCDKGAEVLGGCKLPRSAAAAPARR